MNDVSIILAFSAGLLSFLSPCVLPLVPAYIGYIAGNTVECEDNSKARFNTMKKALGFVIGFSIIFILMGASATTLGQLIVKNKSLFQKIGGVIMVIMGFHTMGLFKIKLLYYEKRLLSSNILNKGASSIILGMAFAAGWTPCVGPILSSILFYAGSLDTIYKGILLLSIYSLGLAVPFLLSAMAIDSFTAYKNKFKKHMSIVSYISGFLLIAMGVMVFTNTVNILSKYLNFINF